MINRYRPVESACVVILLLLIIGSLACVPAGKIPPQVPPAPVAAPSAPAASPILPAVQPARPVIFQDDFKDPGSGWTVFTNDFGEGRYENGGYVLKSTRPGYHGAIRSAAITNVALTSLTSFMLDMDVTMLSGRGEDCFGIVVKWPDINPLGVEGYEQPSDYYFLLAPAGMLVWCYSKQEVKSLSVDKIPGYFLKPTQYTCVSGTNKVNNIKIWFNPGIRFLVNGYELVNATDRHLDYVNRLIKDKAMAGGRLVIGVDSQDTYSNPVFQLNKVAVYENN